MENGRIAFLNPFRGLEATHDVYLSLIRKRLLEFLFMLMELFC